MGWPTNPRPALALVDLRDQIDALYPGRPKQSDGMIGDSTPAHQGTSDHAPWIHDTKGLGVVRAFDITTSAFSDDLAERLRLLGASGDTRLNPLGYIIWDGHIAGYDDLRAGHVDPTRWAWREYTGADPHRSHIHVSVSRSQSGYDRRGAWPLPGTTPPTEETLVTHVIRFATGGSYLIIPGVPPKKLTSEEATALIDSGKVEIVTLPGVSSAILTRA